MWINWQTRAHALSPEKLTRGDGPGKPRSPWLAGPVSHRTALTTCDQRSRAARGAHRWAHRTTHHAAQNGRLTRLMASASRRTHP